MNQFVPTEMPSAMQRVPFLLTWILRPSFLIPSYLVYPLTCVVSISPMYKAFILINCRLSGYTIGALVLHYSCYCILQSVYFGGPF